ncbi:sensor domain-containing diguanylate cyclase [Pseudoalteromonas sp. Cn5-37]|uniref:sensor domain-containing diguanylate cyclase n=1 Tax=unclassified Pseudoalteromonas TaxID=194690 RepID=UPI001F3141B1|nr:sensor domain-containing diguanylate cyclase [Pseudoalteromonas sp. Cn5-37]MCF2915771.1 sensor domain-containing diguanylate cyclase [Pseudoalteromonas sp. Cn5-37]MED5511221.1 sensor domain-containing diguanylate cyclase [Pseudomonadota bacterium]|tara:strand:+ start:891 stop:1859 length:969 start_codon:yes stop_codon:yes gene_type:complete
MLEVNKWSFCQPDNQFSLQKWQKTVDLMTELFSAPAGFIVHKTDEAYRIIVSSEQRENPYHAGIELAIDDNIFCKKVLKDMAPLYIPQVSLDNQWDDCPLTVDGVESYLGVPITWPSGEPFGTFCVMDFKKTDYQHSLLELIEQLRDMVEDDLALLDNFTQMREIAMLDPLTNIYNRRALNLLCQHKLNLAARLGFNICCLFIDIDNFKPLNDKHGHEVGDKALICLADTLKQYLREADIIGRLGGDEFIAVLQVKSNDCIEAISYKLNEAFKENLKHMAIPELNLSIGSGIVAQPKETFAELLKRADEDMYEKKQASKLTR